MAPLGVFSDPPVAKLEFPASADDHAAGVRQHPGVGANLQQPAGEDRVHPAREREVRLAALQARYRLVHRDQRQRAGGIHRHRRPFETQCESDPADGRVERRAGDRIEIGGRSGRLGVLCRVQDQPPVIVVADPRIDAGAATLQPLGIDARVFERPPARLQHQALLRVEQLRFHRRNAEEGGVEPVEPVEVGAEPAGVDLLRVVGELPQQFKSAGCLAYS